MSALGAVGLGVIAQSGDEYQGHFVDQFIDLITAPEAAVTVIDWVRVAIEWFFSIAVFAIPVLVLLYGVRKARWPLAGGGLLGLLAVLWYRTRPDESVASGTSTHTVDGATFDCINAVVDEEGELIECGGSTLIGQLRQNTVLNQWDLGVGEWGEQTVFWVDNNLKDTLAIIRWPFTQLLGIIVDDWLVSMSWLSVCLIIFAIGWAVRSFGVGLMSFIALAICGMLGADYWKETALTIGYISVAVLLCVIVGVPLGVVCGRVDGAWKVVRPVLDAMQVVHSFVYMLPFIFFFGIGVVSSTMVTMVFALPPLVRLTNLGIRQVPEDVVEASRAYGAPERRVLFDVQLPLARPAIMTGLNQTLLLSISMLGIAAIMGAGGLGRLLFQAIQNQDIAQGVAGGLSFFLVAVVLDRISQTDADQSNLLSRIFKAWTNRRTPERLLEEAQAAADNKVSRLAEQPEVPEDSFVGTSRRERSAALASGIGALVMLISLVLPWSADAGLISSYARSSDADLRTEECSGQWIDTGLLDPLSIEGGTVLECAGDISYASNSFNGISASGGSWFGIFIAIVAVTVLWSAAMTLLRPGAGSKWLGAHGAVVYSFAALGLAFGFLVANPPDATSLYSTGFGVWLALVGGLVAAVGAIFWLWRAPMSARRPLTASIGWGRMSAAGFALVLLLMAGFSGWSFDTRAESVITPELQAELDQVAAEGVAAQEAAVQAGAAADEAEAAGDAARAVELRSEETAQLALAGLRAADITAVIARAQRQGDVIFNGFENKGAGLGIWTLVGGIVVLGLSLPAIGSFGIDENLRYRWSALVGGVGLAIAMIPLGWVITIVRVADTNFVTGVGAAFAIVAGLVIFASSRATLAEFERNKDYGDIAALAEAHSKS